MTSTLAKPDDIFCVRRWRRTDHDRLYVDTVDGLQLGYYDLHSGLVHAADASHESQILFVAQRYCRSRPETIVVPDELRDIPPIGEPDPSPIFSQVVRRLGMPPIRQPLLLMDDPIRQPAAPVSPPEVETVASPQSNEAVQTIEPTDTDSADRHLFVVPAA